MVCRSADAGCRLFSLRCVCFRLDLSALYCRSAIDYVIVLFDENIPLELAITFFQPLKDTVRIGRATEPSYGGRTFTNR